MILKCEKCDRFLTDPDKGCQRCIEDARRQKIHASPWAQEPHAWLPMANLLEHAASSDIAKALEVDRNTTTQWARRRKMWTVEQACRAATLLRLNPYKVWPQLETNIDAPPDGWWEHRNCEGVPTDVFYPRARVGRPTKDGPSDPYKQARAICRACEVRNACLWAEMRVENPAARNGMFGGLDERERANLAKGLGWRPRAQFVA